MLREARINFDISGQESGPPFRRLLMSAILISLLGLLPMASALHADWLVTRDGERIETEGEWQVDGRLVRFKKIGGTLSTIRTTEINLERSRAESEAVLAESPPGPALVARPRTADPVLVLTQGDVASASANSSSKSRRIIMYVTDWCGYCKKAKTFFRHAGVSITERDIEKNVLAKREYDRLTRGREVGVPLIDIDGDLFYGFDAGELSQALEARKKR